MNSLVSYAQNFEDVMLWRALKTVEGGFYIDVGAWSPSIDSVTKLFYDSGWCGINIEPNPEFAAELKNERPRDTNLQLAAGSRRERRILNIMPASGLSSLERPLSGLTSALDVKHVETEVRPLADIWDEFVPSRQEVHFLKIDVECHEGEVLKGCNWAKHRPWIVVVEATAPNSTLETHETWEPLLLDARYEFAYADGLNRFYVASEQRRLLPAFKYPPNVFDNFVTSTHVRLREENEKREAYAQSLAASHDGLRVERDELAKDVVRLNEEISARDGLFEKLTAHARSLEMEIAAVRGERSGEVAMAEVSNPASTQAKPRGWQRIFVNSSWTPRIAFRRLLFHTSGKPRGALKPLVQHRNGKPRRLFRHWMLQTRSQQ